MRGRTVIVSYLSRADLKHEQALARAGKAGRAGRAGKAGRACRARGAGMIGKARREAQATKLVVSESWAAIK